MIRPCRCDEGVLRSKLLPWRNMKLWKKPFHPLVISKRVLHLFAEVFRIIFESRDQEDAYIRITNDEVNGLRVTYNGRFEVASWGQNKTTVYRIILSPSTPFPVERFIKGTLLKATLTFITVDEGMEEYIGQEKPQV